MSLDTQLIYRLIYHVDAAVKYFQEPIHLFRRISDIYEPNYFAECFKKTSNILFNLPITSKGGYYYFNVIKKEATPQRGLSHLLKSYK